jgi:hypothetical protein
MEYKQDKYICKSDDEPWGHSSRKQKVAGVTGCAANLRMHTFQVAKSP